MLRHVYPDADIPVVQLSIDERQPASFHYEIGERLGPLREEGVLIAGSGNLVHNLHAYAWGKHIVEPYEWAVRFERQTREMIGAREHKPLVDYERLGRDAQLSIPTPDHYLPLLYVIASRQEKRTRSPFPLREWMADQFRCYASRLAETQTESIEHFTPAETGNC